MKKISIKQNKIKIGEIITKLQLNFFLYFVNIYVYNFYSYTSYWTWELNNTNRVNMCNIIYSINVRLQKTLLT